jgi:hypothetical protein
MSYGDASYTPHAAPCASPLPTRIDYFRAYTYIFDHPQWLTTIGWLGILGLLNLIPPLNLLYALLLVGYGFTVLEHLLVSGDTQYPTFDFGRLQDYLLRGLWPFLVYLVGSIILGIICYVAMFGVTAIGVVAGLILGKRAAGPILGLLAVPTVIGLVGLLLVGNLALWAMALRSGLARDFASGFDYRWTADFLRKMWLELLLCALFLVVTAFVLEILGLMALCVGILFVAPIVALASAHVTYQLYAVYLSRGGTPVAIVQR